MSTKRFVLRLCATLSIGSSLFAAPAKAADIATQNLGQASTSAQEIQLYLNMEEWKHKQSPIKFSMAPEKAKKNQPLMVPLITQAPSGDENRGNQASFHQKSKDKQDWEDEILAKIPQGDRLKRMWKVADGDVDLYFTDLRFDRGNKGVTYKTKKLPFIKEFKNSEFRFDAGEDMEFIFESQALPFKGELEGFHFKASVKEDNQRVFARYTIPFD